MISVLSFWVGWAYGFALFSVEGSDNPDGVDRALLAVQYIPEQRELIIDFFWKYVIIKTSSNND